MPIQHNKSSIKLQGLILLAGKLNAQLHREGSENQATKAGICLKYGRKLHIRLLVFLWVEFLKVILLFAHAIVCNVIEKFRYESVLLPLIRPSSFVASPLLLMPELCVWLSCRTKLKGNALVHLLKGSVICSYFMYSQIDACYENRCQG